MIEKRDVMKVRAVRLTEKDWSHLLALANSYGVSPSEVVRHAVSIFLVNNSTDSRIAKEKETTND